MSKWLKKHKLSLIGLVLVILFGLWFWDVFPDPYHQDENVNIYTWVWREIDELIHGER